MIPLYFSALFVLLEMQIVDPGAQPLHIPCILADPDIVTGTIFALLKCFLAFLRILVQLFPPDSEPVVGRVGASCILMCPYVNSMQQETLDSQLGTV